MLILENEGGIGRAIFAEQDKSEERRVPKLSSRQSEILDLLAKGYNNQEIANVLGVALNTVDAHQRSLYIKLRVHSGLQAVIRGVAIGIINLEEVTEGLDISSMDKLTRKELEVLQKMTDNEGARTSNEQIASLLDRSIATIDYHFGNIQRGLGVNRIQAGLIYMAAKKAGLLPASMEPN